MDETLFSELLKAMREALAHAKGRRDLRTMVLPDAPEPMTAQEVRRLRSRLNASQAVFASYLNVSTKLVQAWESDRRKPDGAALRLLRIAEKAPQLLLASTHIRKAAARKAPSRAAKSSRVKRGPKSRSA